MTGLLLPPDQDALEPIIISVGTCGVLRIKQVGGVFFVENDVGHMESVDGKNVRSEDWKIVAVSKGDKARLEAHDFLARANVDVLKMIQADLAKRRAMPASGTRARGGV